MPDPICPSTLIPICPSINIPVPILYACPDLSLYAWRTGNELQDGGQAGRAPGQYVTHAQRRQAGAGHQQRQRGPSGAGQGAELPPQAGDVGEAGVAATLAHQLHSALLVLARVVAAAEGAEEDGAGLLVGSVQPVGQEDAARRPRGCQHGQRQPPGASPPHLAHPAHWQSQATRGAWLNRTGIRQSLVYTHLYIAYMHARAQTHSQAHTPSIAFRHPPPNSATFSYATEGALFISAQVSSDAVSALRKVRVLIWL